MRALRQALWFSVGVLVAFIVLVRPSFAETVASVSANVSPASELYSMPGGTLGTCNMSGTVSSGAAAQSQLLGSCSGLQTANWNFPAAYICSDQPAFSQSTSVPYYQSPAQASSTGCSPNGKPTIWFYIKASGTQYGPYSAQRTSFTCPSGATASGQFCVAKSCPIVSIGSPYTLSADQTSCSRPDSCTSTADATSTSYWDLGTSPSASLPPLRCISGCIASIAGATTATAPTRLVGGVRHYYGGPVKYQFMGGGNSDLCTASSTVPDASTAQSSPPSSTCSAGSYKAVINGVDRCVSSSTNSPVDTGPQYVAGTSCSKVTNADSTITQTCITQASDGSTTTTATKYPPGTADSAMQKDTTVTTSNPNSTNGNGNGVSVSTGTGSSSGSGSSTPNDPGSMGNYCASHPTAAACAATGADMSAFCAANPTAAACKTTTSPGTGANTSGLYTPDTSGKTFAGSVSTFASTVQGSAFYSATAGFFHAPSFSGSCSGLSTTLTILTRTFTFDAGQYLCSTTADTWYGYLGAGLLALVIAASFYIAIIL